MTAEDFLSALTSEVPEAEPIVREHLEDNDELLLHLLTADLRRYAIDMFESERSDVLRRLLGVIDRALLLGNDSVSNAMAVSFVEDSGQRLVGSSDAAVHRVLATGSAGRGAQATRILTLVNVASSADPDVARDRIVRGPDTDHPDLRPAEHRQRDPDWAPRSAAACAITAASECNGACRQLPSAGDLIAE